MKRQLHQLSTPLSSPLERSSTFNFREMNRTNHRGFAFVSYSTAEATLDAIDNMNRNVLPGVTNKGKPLKVNRAKPQKGGQKGASNKPSEFTLL